jgi:hypothetical protein
MINQLTNKQTDFLVEKRKDPSLDKILCYKFRNVRLYYVTATPNPQVGGLPIVSCLR